MSLPFSQACENNKVAIAEVLCKRFCKVKRVLEIGSGTGQHAVYFAAMMPQLTWFTSDVLSNHWVIQARIDEANISNVVAPKPFSIGTDSWPVEEVDAVFSANTAHIMQWFEVQLMFELISTNLRTGSLFCLYGPFKQAGKHNSQSNSEFDDRLRANGFGGVPDIDDLEQLSRKVGLQLTDINPMPANNRLIFFKKT